MATVTHNKDAAKILQGMPLTGIVGWRKLGPILKQIVSRLLFVLSVDGLTASEIARGFHLALAGGGQLNAMVRIRTDLQNVAFVPDPEGDAAAFEVSPTSQMYLAASALSASGEITYTWTKDGIPYQTAQGAMVGTNSVIEADAGLYICQITDSSGGEAVIKIVVTVSSD